MTYIEVDDKNKYSPELSIHLRVRIKDDVVIVEMNGMDYIFDRHNHKKDYHGDNLAFIEARYTPGT